VFTTPASGTFTTQLGPSSNVIDATAAFVSQHYLDFLTRDPDTSGFAFWLNEINSCGNNLGCVEVKRRNVSAAFFLTPEFLQTGLVVYRTTMASFGTLRRFTQFFVLSGRAG